MESRIMALEDNKRCAFAVRLAERAVNYIHNDSVKERIVNALELCRNYVNARRNSIYAGIAYAGRRIYLGTHDKELEFM